MFVSTSAAPVIKIPARPSAVPVRLRHLGIPLAAALAVCRLVEEAESCFEVEDLAAIPRGRHVQAVAADSPVDIVAGPNAELAGERLRHGDLELAGNLGHVGLL